MKVHVETAKDGHKVPIIDIEGNPIHLGSMYDGRRAAEVWIEAKLPKDVMDLALVGLGDLQILAAAGEVVRERIIVYEPEKSIYDAMRSTPLMKKINRNPRVAITTNIDEFCSLMADMVNRDVIESTFFYVHPGYCRDPWLEDIENIRQVLDDYIEQLQFLRHESQRYIKQIVMNELRNIVMLRDGILLSRIQGKWNRNIPMIIVGAGPSLKKNVHELKRVGNKACILCMDSALTTLLNAGIRPHFVASVDIAKPYDIFVDVDHMDIPMLVISNSRSGVVFRSPAPKIWCYESHEFANSVRTMIEERPPIFPTKEGVSSLALSVAIELGVRKIVFVGTDMAFGEDGQTHADVLDDGDTRSEEYKAEGYFGGEVYTRYDWEKMRSWLERTIREDDNTTYINSTEGGVRIKGTSQLPLRKVIDSLPESDGQWYEIINSPEIRISNQEYEIMMKRFDEELSRFEDTIGCKMWEEVFLDKNYQKPLIFGLFIATMRSCGEATRPERFEKAKELVRGFISQVQEERKDGYIDFNAEADI